MLHTDTYKRTAAACSSVGGWDASDSRLPNHLGIGRSQSRDPSRCAYMRRQDNSHTGGKKCRAVPWVPTLPTDLHSIVPPAHVMYSCCACDGEDVNGCFRRAAAMGILEWQDVFGHQDQARSGQAPCDAM